jgi:SAM-dependent methyltransferase
MIASLEIATLKNFDEELYLLANADVANALRETGVTAYDHFLLHGMKEKRNQVKREDALAYAGSRRLKKYERFKHILAPEQGSGGQFRFGDLADAFPVSYGYNHCDLGDYASESANHGFLPFVREMEENPDKLFMDVGCGFRHQTYENCLYVEVYNSRSADLVMEPACNYPIADGSLDGIGCFAVLEHVEEPWVVAKEFHRMLKPGGKVYIDWPFLQPVHGYPSHYYNATRAGLDRMFDSGFERISSATLDSQTPDHTVTWILSGWSHSLKSDAVRERLHAMTVGELIATPPGSEFWKSVLAERSTYACGNTLIAQKC